MEKTEQNLADFSWDTEETFFGVPTSGDAASAATATRVDDPEPEPSGDELDGGDESQKGDDPTNLDDGKGKEVTTEDVDEFFGTKTGGNTSEQTINTEETTNNEPEQGKYWNDVYADFKENGLFNHVEIEEGEELDAEKLFELQNQEYQAEVQARLQSWAQNDLDEDAQAFIKFKTQGGRTEDFFKTYQSTYELPQGDVEDEAYQDKVIRYQLKREGWDADEIEDRLEYLTTSKKKKSVAKRYNSKLEKNIEEEKQALIEQVEAQKKAAQKQEEAFKTTLKDTLGATKEVKGFKITAKDQTNLYNLLTRKQYKTESGTQITGFQKKIGEAFQDPEKMILLAKIIDSDFDMSGFEKKAETRTTRKIKSRLEQHKSTSTNSGSSLGGGSIADFF